MKSLLLTALCAVSLQANAQVVYGIGGKYDYDVATENNIGLNTVAQTSLVGGIRGKFGQLDAGFYGVRIDADRLVDHVKGVEIGYGPAFPLGPVMVTTRAAVGKLTNRAGPADSAYYRTFTIGASFPINDKISPYVSYRYRPGQDLVKQDQYTIGVMYNISKQAQLQTGYRQTRSANSPILNGLTTQVLFIF